MTDLPAARILDVTPDAYHRLPGFSASIARIVIRQSELHAKDAADRQAELLAEDDESEDDEDVSDDKRKRLEQGSIWHALVLGVGKRIEVIPSALLAKNGALSTKDGKAFAAAARERGCIPVKEPDMETNLRIAGAMKARIAEAGHTLDGISEFAIEWHEATPHGPVKCRCMIDHVALLSDGEVVAPGYGTLANHAIIYELKPVGDAAPERCNRTAENLGYAIAAAAYPRALNALYPRLQGRIEFRYLWVETRRPYAVWDPIARGPYMEIGERRWVRARNAWAAGLATGRWPDYRTPGNEEMSAPMWTLRQEGYTPGEM
ncbi:MAG TPA: hypothetical protein VJU58_13780 [Microbacterium sp.]|nr:hypothetical protein [Microbacterium sp.]